jgi:hypothetical protein
MISTRSEMSEPHWPSVSAFLSAAHCAQLLGLSGKERPTARGPLARFSSLTPRCDQRAVLTNDLARPAAQAHLGQATRIPARQRAFPSATMMGRPSPALRPEERPAGLLEAASA